MKNVNSKETTNISKCYNFLQCSITSEYMVIEETIFNALILLKSLSEK